jgi:hypothetical protein
MMALQPSVGTLCVGTTEQVSIAAYFLAREKLEVGLEEMVEITRYCFAPSAARVLTEKHVHCKGNDDSQGPSCDCRYYGDLISVLYWGVRVLKEAYVLIIDIDATCSICSREFGFASQRNCCL